MIYLHVGNPKTGTTTIQRSLFDNRIPLLKQQVLYPQAGIQFWGHHNIYYDLAKDPDKYNPSLGSFELLLKNLRIFKEQNPEVKIWGVDTYGSVFKKYHETGIFDEKEIYPYITEGIGEDILPKNVDFDVIDLFEKVSDKDGAVMARRLAREEGILLGYSCGSAMAGLHQLKDKLTKDDVVVIIFHDHGSRYIGKVYNDDWMRERGFLDTDLKVKDLVASKQDKSFMSANAAHTVKEVLKLMKENDISQLPVMKDEDIIGSISESKLLEFVLDNPLHNSDKEVSSIMEDAFPEVDMDMNAKDINRYMSKKTPAVITKDQTGTMHILTQYDILQAL